jgi:hypothetical protein
MPLYNTAADKIQCEIDCCVAQLQEGWATPMIMIICVGLDNVVQQIELKTGALGHDAYWAHCMTGAMQHSGIAMGQCSAVNAGLCNVEFMPDCLWFYCTPGVNWDERRIDSWAVSVSTLLSRDNVDTVVVIGQVQDDDHNFPVAFLTSPTRLPTVWKKKGTAGIGFQYWRNKTNNQGV